MKNDCRSWGDVEFCLAQKVSKLNELIRYLGKYIDAPNNKNAGGGDIKHNTECWEKFAAQLVEEAAERRSQKI